MAVGVVTGMQAEAKIAGRHADLVGCGTRAEGARKAAEALVAAGATALMSFGIAGGLDPDLEPGSLILATSVSSDEGEIEADAAWRADLARSLGHAHAERLFSADDAAVDASAKQALRRRYNAAAVDLESYAVAKVARAAGLPFAALRAVADDAETSLPPAALVGLGDDGRPAVGRVLWSLARQPGQIGRLVRVAGDSRSALNALVRAGRAVGHGFQAP